MAAGVPAPLPRRLALAVALLTAGMLLLELVVTRLFSVLFFYHYSFFAVSLVMSGLSFGGLLASRWDVRGASEGDVDHRLARLALVFGVATAAALLFVVLHPPMGQWGSPTTATVALFALSFVPGLTAAGAFLAVAFAREPAWIGRLYAADLVAAAAACAAAVVVLRVVQGPAALLVTVLLAALAALVVRPPAGLVRTGAGVVAAVATLGIGMNVSRGAAFLRLPVDEGPVLERWNEHSRVAVPHGMRADGDRLVLVVDKTASMSMWRTQPRPAGTPVPIEPEWGEGSNYLGYRLGRPLRRTAVIGVGGGRDILAALAHGAEHVDGYELNGVLLDLARNDLAAYNGMASWPEVSLVHDEGRVGIAHGGQRYDLIQASLVDTWAATAAGGFVLSENGLYTVEGWRTFLAALDEGGLLTMTRFYVPTAPVEMERLVNLAAVALQTDGVADPRAHVALVSNVSEESSRKAHHVWGTILVSKPPFSAAELAALAAAAEAGGWQLLVAPGTRAHDPVVGELLDPARRAEAVAASPYDISAPTDLRPFFFLQLRPRDVLTLTAERAGFPFDVTFRAVRVMILLAGLAFLFAAAVLVLAATTLPSAHTTPVQARLYRWMSGYFLGIGFGYILIQLGLHQRLTLILGHPTLALAVVLGAMLLGTGLGSFASRAAFPDRRMGLAWITILVVLALVVVSVPAFSGIERIDARVGRAAAAGVATGVVGFVLGFGFPLGVRLVAPAGEWAVQKMWAVNGAASIAGSSVAALLGLALGCRAVLGAGLLAYVFVALSGVQARRLAVAATADVPLTSPTRATG